MKSASNLKLEPHRFRDEDAELGTMRVPVFHEEPSGATLEIRFVRLRGGSRPPVIFLTGGPGLSGIRAGEGRLYPMFAALRGHADVILLDQRACLPGVEWPRTQPVFDRTAPVSRAEYAREIARCVEEEANALKQRGIPVRALNTNESADDVAMLARTLYGENARVALLGWSYGSHLAMAIMKRHESLVARAVLAAPEGPDHTFKRPSRIQQHLERIADRARPQFDVIGSLTRVLERVEKSPVRVDDAFVGRFEMEWIVSEALGDPRMLRQLPTWLEQMDRGDFSVLSSERLLRNARVALRDELPRGVARYAIDCASGATAARRALIEREARETLLGATIDFPLPEICAAVDCPDLGDEFRSPLRSDVPVLFITGTLDCRTPAENVEELSPGFPNHQHLVVEDVGHGDLLLGASAQKAISKFLHGSGRYL